MSRRPNCSTGRGLSEALDTHDTDESAGSSPRECGQGEQLLEGHRFFLMLVRRLQGEDVEEGTRGADGGPTGLALLPTDLLELIRHRVVYDWLGFEGCCQYGQVAALRYVRPLEGLSEADRDRHLNSDEWPSPLELAGLGGHVGVAQFLIDSGADKTQLKQVLFLACEYGHVDMVSFLMSLGKETIHCTGTDVVVALNKACRHGHEGVVRSLCECGADVNMGLRYAWDFESGFDGGSDWYNDDDDDDDDVDSEEEDEEGRRRYPLSHACYSGHVGTIKALVEHGASINADDDAAFETACRFGRLEAAEYLVEQGADALAREQRSLRYACQNGHLDIVKFLVKHVGADVRAAENEPLIEACRHGHLHVVEFLVSEGAKVNDGPRPHGRYYPMLLSSEAGHLDIVKYLVDHGAAVEACGTEAAVEACKNGHLDVVKTLVDMGADVLRGGGESALCSSSRNGHLEMVQFLVEELNADVHVNRNRAMKEAESYGHPNIAEYLRSRATE